MPQDRCLLTCMIAYGAASFVHFAHNAMYIDSYPNLPVWITPIGDERLDTWRGNRRVSAVGRHAGNSVQQPVTMSPQEDRVFIWRIVGACTPVGLSRTSSPGIIVR